MAGAAPDWFLPPGELVAVLDLEVVVVLDLAIVVVVLGLETGDHDRLHGRARADTQRKVSGHLASWASHACGRHQPLLQARPVPQAATTGPHFSRPPWVRSWVLGLG